MNVSKHLLPRAVVAFVALAASALGCRPGSDATAEERVPPCTLYDSDPTHIWNRLHDALFTRIGPDGRPYGRDRLEPLLWPQTTNLPGSQSGIDVVKLLEQLDARQGESRIREPLKRAVLQRDLWLVYRWADTAGKIPLADELAKAIRRLALTAEEIKVLPDNYAAAVASGEFARTAADATDDKPYLPPDLFAADGPWVCVGRPDGPIAPGHMRENLGNSFTNSAFLVFLRLPEGRAATIDYLARLRGVARQEAAELPDFPKGAELALVRRALLIDATNHFVASPLTESVQLRIRGESMSFHELRLTRSSLFSTTAGGLRAIAPGERDFKTGFRGHAFDPFEDAPRDQPFEQYQQPVVLDLCNACHRSDGVGGFNSLFNQSGGNTGGHGNDTSKPVPLTDTSVDESLAASVRWKETRPEWTDLRKLLEK